MQDVLQPLDAGGSHLPLTRHQPKPAQWLEGQRHGGEEGHELPDGFIARDDFGAAKHQHPQKAHACHNVDQRGHGGLAGDRTDFGAHPRGT